MGNNSTVRLMVELFPDFCTFNQILTFRKIGNSSTISLTVELFPTYAFELFPIYAIRTIYAFPLKLLRHSISSHPCSLSQKFIEIR